MTVCVDVKNGIIIETPPIVKKFKGQPLTNLINWLKKIDRKVDVIILFK